MIQSNLNERYEVCSDADDLRQGRQIAVDARHDGTSRISVIRIVKAVQVLNAEVSRQEIEIQERCAKHDLEIEELTGEIERLQLQVIALRSEVNVECGDERYSPL